MNIRGRTEKLEKKIKPQQPIIVLMEGKGPTEAQQKQIDKAAAAGIKPHIIQIGPASKEKVQHGS